MIFRPLGSNVLLLPLDGHDLRITGGSMMPVQVGKVLAMGDEVKELAVGDKVSYLPDYIHASVVIDNAECAVVNMSDIFGVFLP